MKQRALVMKLLSTNSQALLGVIEAAGAYGVHASPERASELKASVDTLARACESVGLTDVGRGLRGLCVRGQEN